jgi:hypothetical protein
MAIPSTILPSNDTCIVSQNTTSGIDVNSGASIGTVVSSGSSTVGVGQVVMYRNVDNIQFQFSGNFYQVVPIKNILLTYQSDSV